MKKIITVLLACLFLLSACSYKTDENGWFSSFDEVKKAAASKNKNIIILVNSFRDNGSARKGTELLLNSNFAKTVSTNYLCVHFDFLNETEAHTIIPEDMSPEEKKAVLKRKAELEKQYAAADMYNIKQTPAAVLITKEGYFISDLDFDFYSEQIEDYIKTVEANNNNAKRVNAAAALTRKGNKYQRIKAIDDFYESQPEAYRFLLAGLYKKIPEMDKSDKSGLVSKYLAASANADAFTKLLELEVADAAKIYVKYAEDERVNALDRQTLYYLAANMLISSSSEDFTSIIDLLQKSLDASPESNYAAALSEMIEKIVEIQKNDI